MGLFNGQRREARELKQKLIEDYERQHLQELTDSRLKQLARKDGLKTLAQAELKIRRERKLSAEALAQARRGVISEMEKIKRESGERRRAALERIKHRAIILATQTKKAHRYVKKAYKKTEKARGQAVRAHRSLMSDLGADFMRNY